MHTIYYRIPFNSRNISNPLIKPIYAIYTLSSILFNEFSLLTSHFGFCSGELLGVRITDNVIELFKENELFKDLEDDQIKDLENELIKDLENEMIKNRGDLL